MVGRIRRPHGVKGEVLAEVLTDVPERLRPGSLLWAEAAGGRRRLTVTGCRRHHDGALLAFAEVADRDAAGELRGVSLTVERSAVPPPPDGAYYHWQLLGCRVSDRAAGELGEVVDLVEDGGGLLLLVEGGRGVVPVPFVESYLRALDVEEGRIEVELPAGLLEACGGE